MPYVPVTPNEIADMDGLDGWRAADGILRAEFRASSFTDAGELVRVFAAAADDADHHPDIVVRYPGRVEVSLSTHAIGGLSMHDVDLARHYSRLATEHGASPEPE